MDNKKGSKIKKVVFYWLPVFIWCFFIYYLSSLPSLKSDFPSYLDLVLRKMAHITEFAMLTFLFFRAAILDMDRKSASVHAVLFAFVFAITDEYHQTFIWGRNGNLFDIIIDSIGIFIAYYLFNIKKIKNLSN